MRLMQKHFTASWSPKLKGTTAVFTLILLAVAVLVREWGALIAFAVFLISAAFAVRGYSLVDGQLLIHRLGWATKFDLSALSSAEVSPGATLGSIRTLGIGGLFGFVGHYRNQVLGSYKAYATNELNTVVLDFSGEVIVVTPDSPEEFVDAMKATRNP